MAIFCLIQNLAMWHVTCWNESGRKLPTAYTSQQLLGGWGQRDIFFHFFCTQKTQKNMDIFQLTGLMLTLDFMSETFVRNVRNPELFGSSKVEFWGVQNRTFWTFPEKSGNPEILKNPEFSEKSEKSQKSGKSRKSRLFGTLKGILRKPQKSCLATKISKIRTFPEKCDFLDFVSGHDFLRFPESEKKCENFGIFDLKKIEKNGQTTVGNVDRNRR